MKPSTFDFVFSLACTEGLKWSVFQLALQSLSQGPQLAWDEKTKKTLLSVITGKFRYSNQHLLGKNMASLFARDKCPWAFDAKFADFMVNTFDHKMLTEQSIDGFGDDRPFFHVLLDHLFSNDDIYALKYLDHWIDHIDYKHFQSWVSVDKSKSSLAQRVFSLSYQNTNDDMDQVAAALLVEHVARHMDWKGIAAEDQVRLAKLFTLPQQWESLLNAKIDPDQLVHERYHDELKVPLWWAVFRSSHNASLTEHMTQWAQRHRSADFLRLRSQEYFRTLEKTMAFGTLDSVKANIRSEKDWEKLVNDEGQNALMLIFEKSRLNPSHVPVKKTETQLAMRDPQGRSPAFYLLQAQRLADLPDWCALVFANRSAMEPHEGKGLLVQLAQAQKNIEISAPLARALRHSHASDWFSGSDEEVGAMVGRFASNPEKNHVHAMSMLAERFGQEVSHPQLLGYLALCTLVHDQKVSKYSSKVDNSEKLSDVRADCLARGAILPDGFNAEKWKDVVSSDSQEYKQLLAQLQANAISEELAPARARPGIKKKM